MNFKEKVRSMKKCSILGLGWYGRPLAVFLQKKGLKISGSTRDTYKAQQLQENQINAIALNYPEQPPEELLNVDILILNIPPFEEQLDWFKSWKWNKNTWIIFISSTSVYPRPESKNAELLFKQEEWVKTNFSDWTIIRFGGLIGPDRHPGNHLSGKKNLSGRLWPVNLIHLEDTINFTNHVIDKNLKHTSFNLVSDEHPTREEYYTEYCLRKNLPLPEFNQEDISEGKIVPSITTYQLRKTILHS